MLLKGAKKIYEERNQSKNSIRNRKEAATTNNQRLLSTANKPKIEIKNIEGIVPLSIQKQKIHMNTNVGQPPLSRPAARKTLPLTSGLDTLAEVEKPLVNTKVAPYIEDANRLGKVISLSQMVNKLQEQLT